MAVGDRRRTYGGQTGFRLDANFTRLLATGWKEKFVLHFRFDENTCKVFATKLTLIFDFQIKIFFFLALYSTRREGT